MLHELPSGSLVQDVNSGASCAHLIYEMPVLEELQHSEEISPQRQSHWRLIHVKDCVPFVVSN